MKRFISLIILMFLITFTGCSKGKNTESIVEIEEAPAVNIYEEAVIDKTGIIEDESSIESIAGYWIFIAADIYGEYNENCVNRDYFLKISKDGSAHMEIEGRVIDGLIKVGGYDWEFFYGSNGKFNVGRIRALDPFLNNCLDITIPVQDITVATFKNIKTLD